METSVSNTSNNIDSTSKTSTQESSGPAAPSAGVVPGNARLAIGFLTRDTDAELIVDCEHVETSMKGNKAYLLLAANVADVGTSRIAFIAAVGEAKVNRIAISARRKSRAILVGKMRDLANYVQVASGGDLPTLRSSGFPIRQQQSAVGQLPAPLKLRAVRGKASGQIVARCARVEKATAYQWRCGISTTAPIVWLPAAITFSAHHTFEDLTPCVTYATQVCAVGRTGSSDWSDVASVIVL